MFVDWSEWEHRINKLLVDFNQGGVCPTKGGSSLQEKPSIFFGRFLRLYPTWVWWATVTLEEKRGKGRFGEPKETKYQMWEGKWAL